MPDIHAKPFDEGTLTKLDLFSLYAREWLPVFLACRRPFCGDVHVFDFFAGEGTDSAGTPGSPLRVMDEAAALLTQRGPFTAKLHLHFYDADEGKIAKLQRSVAARSGRVPDVRIEVRALPFAESLAASLPVLGAQQVAKLVFIDQYGVDQVDESRFRGLVECPTTDLLFFISSSFLHRFRDHPSMPFRVGQPTDYYHIHREVLRYFRGLVPPGLTYFLAPFSIRKGANIYGVIFGSAHPLGMDKFLQAAWKTDATNGEANFDINREGLNAQAPTLPFDEFRPTKITAFEHDLRARILARECTDELQMTRVCFEHGVTRQHASPVLSKLKEERLIHAAFRTPDTGRTPPRPVQLLHGRGT